MGEMNGKEIGNEDAKQGKRKKAEDKTLWLFKSGTNQEDGPLILWEILGPSGLGIRKASSKTCQQYCATNRSVFKISLRLSYMCLNVVLLSLSNPLYSPTCLTMPLYIIRIYSITYWYLYVCVHHQSVILLVQKNRERKQAGNNVLHLCYPSS